MTEGQEGARGFNEQYEETIATIQARAVWRVGERRDEVEGFRCLCPKCGYESQHRREDITRHRLVFGKSIRQIEAARPVVVCQRCGLERHARDIAELVVPTTVRLYDSALGAAAERLASGADSNPELGKDVLDALRAFREEASGPLRQQLLTELAADARSSHRPVLEAIGSELSLTDRQIRETLDQIS